MHLFRKNLTLLISTKIMYAGQFYVKFCNNLNLLKIIIKTKKRFKKAYTCFFPLFLMNSCSWEFAYKGMYRQTMKGAIYGKPQKTKFEKVRGSLQKSKRVETKPKKFKDSLGKANPQNC